MWLRDSIVSGAAFKRSVIYGVQIEEEKERHQA